MRWLLVVAVLGRVASAEPSREVEQLAQTAHSLARDGHCAALPDIARRVQALDADYYERVFLLDPALVACVSAPSAHDEPRELRDPGFAFELSLGITAAGGLLVLAADKAPEGRGPLAVAGIAALAIGPTAGHIYAGHTWNAALGVRIAMTGTALVGATMILQCIDECSNGARDTANTGAIVFVASGFVYAFATLVEIASAPSAAADFNKAHATVTIAPLRAVDGTLPALVVAGRF